MDQEPEGSATVEESLAAVSTDSTEVKSGTKESAESNCDAEKEEKEKEEGKEVKEKKEENEKEEEKKDEDKKADEEEKKTAVLAVEALPTPQNPRKDEEDEEKDSESVSKEDLKDLSSIQSPLVAEEKEEELINTKENSITEENDVSKLVEMDNIESKNDEETPAVADSDREESIGDENNDKVDFDKENSTPVPLQEEESGNHRDRDSLTRGENLDDDNNLRKEDSASLEEAVNKDRDSETHEDNFGDDRLTKKYEDSSDSTLIGKGDELRETEIGSKLTDSTEDEYDKRKEGNNIEKDGESVDEVETRCDKRDEGDNDVKKSSTGIVVSDSSMDCQDKDLTVEKNSVLVEPENTEFVQISQEDKHDESQIENQSIDNAEDPFGGDNLTLENLDEEQMNEGENLAGEIGDFQKLGDQADNLQAVVKAKDKSKDVDFGDKLPEKNDSGSENTAEEGGGSVRPRTELSNAPENEIGDKENDKIDSGLENLDKDKPGSEDRQKGDKEDGKIEEKEGIAGLETDEVLPGQDDELCIIPDSMKVILPEKTTTESAKTAETETAESVEISEKDIGDKEVAIGKNSSVEVEKEVEKEEQSAAAVPEKPLAEKMSVDHSRPQKKYGKDTGKKSVTKSLKKGIINLDEEPKKGEIEEIHSKEKCKQCNEVKSCKIKVKVGSETFNVCSKECRNTFKTANNKATDIPSDGVNSKREKRCAGCLLIVESNDERNLSWETMEFCNEECLGKFQTKYGSYCRNCNGSVQAVSLGKYCVRFGYDVRQFCCSTCLEEFKKGLKVCSYCQKDISSGTEGFLAPVGDKGQFKDFCTQDCMEKYSRMSSSEPPVQEKKSCSVCQEEKIVHCEVQINGGGQAAICSDPCFAAFKFVNKVDPDLCSTCKKFFQLLSKKNFVVFYEGEAHMFCNKTCLNVFIITNRKIVPCNWCKVKKYNFDMIKKELKSGQVMMMCSLNCLTLYQVSINAVSARRINCDFCKEFSQAQYHLTMSDATIRNFCSYKCVMNFQSQYTKSPITIPSSDDPVPTGIPKRTILQQRTLAQVAPKPAPDHQTKSLPVISSVTSLATIGNGQSCNKTVQNCNKTGQNSQQNSVNNLGANVAAVQTQPPQIVFKQQIIARPPSPVKVHNRVTQCKPLMHTKGVSVRPHPCTKSTQTDDNHQIVVPIPVPIYVPYPMHMYSMPFPVPFPFPLPIPVPIFIPTTRNSAKGIFKEIKRIQEKIPADPFEAELLMMAEMVATEKKANDTESDSDDDNRDDVADVAANPAGDGFSPEGVDSSNTFGDDMLQMALKMATGELDEPAVDLEAALTPNTITATQAPPQQDSAIDGDVQPESRLISTRGRKRMVSYKPRSTPSKRGRRLTGTTNENIPLMPPPESQQPPPQPRIMEPIEKPDANMALKYTFGVNAWRQWVVGKNAELEKQNTQTRRVKLFKTELLQLTADELNYSLCLFVKEVRKPNGAEYAPDTIYYLCLGIQQYLFENNRIDNIFTDSYYEKFTDCLNEVAKKFSVLYNDAQYIVTRVEEEHLWESKQLGAHSPHVLLSTLMFFNTKHFNLVTVDEHMQLSFSHIMKHWKRNPAAQPAAVAGKVPGSRNVLLRFYPPQSALEANSRKKKVYEQQENEENPLRCPVKLYEFYLSKCPESVKTRNDVFYLLPERSCVPDSPVWYSTSPLAKEQLIKMLYRVKMVKEINVALLTS